MKSFIIKKDFIDSSILNKINDDVLRQLDIFIRDSNLFHRGMENLSLEPRPMVALTLSKKDIATTEVADAAFGGGEIELLKNWFESNTKGRFSEHIYMHFPILRSLKRIIASIVKDKNLST
jgi:hypothetical protein